MDDRVMSYHPTKDLLRKVAKFWNRGEPIPVSLGAEMLEAGLDVMALEDQNLYPNEPMDDEDWEAHGYQIAA